MSKANDDDAMRGLHTLIVGIGSQHGDDQAGWLIAERLSAGLDQPRMSVRTAASPVQLLDWLGGVDRLIVCDACRGLGRIGEVRRWVWPAKELIEASWSGTHDLSLSMTLQLAGSLGRLPRDVVIWSVEVAVERTIDGISSEITSVLPEIVDRITRELACDVHEKDETCMNSR